MFNPSLRTLLSEQCHQIIKAHHAAILPYLEESPTHDERLHCILERIERLNTICQQPPESATAREYKAAKQDFHELGAFLRLLDQPTDGEFERTHMGDIWAKADHWLHAAGSYQRVSTTDDIWDWIDPVIPDTLEDLGNGIFEAKWAAPVPVMDIEILKRTEGVQIHGDVFEPRGLPNGLAIRFVVSR